MVFQEVKTIMGGRVLDFEAKRIRDQGISIGEARTAARYEAQIAQLKAELARTKN